MQRAMIVRLSPLQQTCTYSSHDEQIPNPLFVFYRPSFDGLFY
jgi:hypothetical protein